MPPLEGIPVSPGYAAGTAIVYAYEIERRLKVPHHSVTRSEIRTEHGRLNDAVEQSNRELKGAEAIRAKRTGPSRLSGSASCAFALGGRPCRESQATRGPGVGECGEGA